MRKSTTILSLCLLFLFLTSCDKDEDRDVIPYVYVNFDIYPNGIHFITNGQYIYVTGGYKGIIIYRPQNDEFIAYERACPHDPLTEGARVEVESSGIIAVDSICGSRFLLTDGSPIEGPASIGLKQYRTHWDGNVLKITN